MWYWIGNGVEDTRIYKRARPISSDTKVGIMEESDYETEVTTLISLAAFSILYCMLYPSFYSILYLGRTLYCGGTVNASRLCLVVVALEKRLGQRERRRMLLY